MEKAIVIVALLLTGAWNTERLVNRVSQQVDLSQRKRWEQTLDKPDWDNLVLIRPLLSKEIALYVKDNRWQEFRTSLLSQDLSIRYVRLWEWIRSHNFDKASRVQVTNYVNALKRGGLIK